MAVARGCWERYGLIAELAWRLKDKRGQFGKTALQKMIYLLEEIYGVDCGYEFSFYIYGPYSKELLNDLDFVEALGGVEVQYMSQGLGGYHIAPGRENELLRKKAEKFLQEKSETLDRLIDEFGTMGAKELELRTTIIYADKFLQRTGKELNRDDFIKLIKQIKPFFDAELIVQALEELEKKKYVSITGK